MGIHRGPNLVKDGLVFGCDTNYGVADKDTSTRFYKGKPTTNYLSSGVSNYNVVQGAAWSGATPTFTLGTSEFGTPIGTYTVGSTSYMYSYDQVLDDDFAAIGGQVVTFSIYLKRTGASANVGIRVYDNVSGYSTVYAAATGEFQRFSMTKTLGANPTRVFVMIDNTNGGVIDFHSPMLEKGSYATPFIDGTRSSTESLIDLKRDKQMTLSAMTYDATGQPDYDGTDDYINLGDYAPIKLGVNFTIECVVRPEQDKWMYFFHKGYGSNNSLAWGRHSSNDNWFFSTMTGGVYQNRYMGTATLNKYCHLVATYDGANLRLYENGVIKLTSAMTHSMLTSTASAGIGGPDRYWNGKIPVMKVLNQVFSQTEVTQNFNTYKNRFNI